MFLAPLALAAALPAAFEDLADLDARIAAWGTAAPVDRRLKLARCPAMLDIAPLGANAVAVRCTPLGWRILVPLVQSARNAEGTPDIRKGDEVEISAEGDGFSISMPAIAMEDGRTGVAMRVRTSPGNPPFSVTVTGPGRARTLSSN